MSLPPYFFKLSSIEVFCGTFTNIIIGFGIIPSSLIIIFIQLVLYIKVYFRRINLKVVYQISDFNENLGILVIENLGILFQSSLNRGIVRLFNFKNWYSKVDQSSQGDYHDQEATKSPKHRFMLLQSIKFQVISWLMPKHI